MCKSGGGPRPGWIKGGRGGTGKGRAASADQRVGLGLDVWREPGPGPVLLPQPDLGRACKELQRALGKQPALPTHREERDPVQLLDLVGRQRATIYTPPGKETAGARAAKGGDSHTHTHTLETSNSRPRVYMVMVV